MQGTASRALGLLIAAGLVVAGCSSGSSTAKSDDTTPTTSTRSSSGSDGGSSGDQVACSLLSADDLEAEGVTVTSGPKQNELAPTDECDFELQPEPGASPPVPGKVVVTMYTPTEAVALKPETYSDSETISGLGNVSWYSPSLKTQWVRFDDDRVLTVQLVVLNDEPEAKARVNAWTETAAESV